MLTSLALLSCFLQDKADTLGKTNAQILAMGRSGWYDYYTHRQGESTVAMSGAQALYGDALMWRNDRLKRPGTARVRKVLMDARNDAIGVGSALTGGGTMWNIVASGFYADAEESLYRVLTRTGKAPKRVVSDLDKAYRGLETRISKEETEYAKAGRAALPRLRKSLDALIAEAKRWPRRESDVLLDFGVQVAKSANTG